MVIKRSSAAEIRALVEALTGPDDVRREAAIARLAVIGSRAVDRLIAVHDEADARGRAAILRSLDAIGDPRALPLAREAVARGGAEATAGIGVLRALLDCRVETAATEALDVLVRTALDPASDPPVRLAAFEALPETPETVRVQVRQALPPGDTPPDMSETAGDTPESPDAIWTRALDGRLPDRPAPLLDILPARAASAPLSTLQRLIDRVRVRERETACVEWRVVRGLLHQALAERGSRVALYDLRESFCDAGEPLPLSFLTAVQEIGDVSCLDALASAMARAPEADTWWRQHIASAFQEVARRERITRRHGAMKRALAKCPALAGG